MTDGFTEAGSAATTKVNFLERVLFFSGAFIGAAGIVLTLIVAAG